MKIREIIYRVESCSSTNDLAREMAIEGAQEGTVIISTEQTKGRGTKGRSWYSVKNKGLYLSIILRPENSNISLLPLMAGLAVKEAIFKTLKLSIGLRWPNDLIWKDCKLGGILSESSFLGNRVNYIILGIGLNLSQKKEDFPEEIRSIATSLKLITGKIVDEAALLRNLWKALNRWYLLFCQGQGHKIVWSFEKNSIFPPGKKITVESEKGLTTGIYRGIDSFGGLILEAGRKKTSFFSTEIKAITHE